MIPRLKNRISFWFSPNEKATNFHISLEEDVSGDVVKSLFTEIASKRYPTLFKKNEVYLFSYPILNRPARLHVGDPAGINAWYTILPVMECNGRFFEIKEIF